MPTTEMIAAVVGFSLGMLVFYLTAYSKAKGQNRALREDLSNLEHEKQKIVAKYRAETEELKKQHALDIEKRKYQYEDKRAQFVKYFALLDEFHGKSNKVFSEQFPPIMNNFLSSYIIDDEATKQKAIVDFNEEVQKIFNLLYKEQLKVTTETNSIRLISSETMDHLLDDLEGAVKQATDSAAEMLKFMATPEFWADQTLLVPYQERATIYAHNVKNCHDALRKRMKFELDEI